MALAEDFEAIDAQTITNFIANGQEEHLQLDFKTISNANLGSTDDRRNLAKAVGGFANSSGGIIVWGVTASRDPTRDNMDCATGQTLIDPVALFVTRLNALTGEASSPTVDGVRHKAIVVSGTAGLAVTLVPESSSTPHMSKLGENRYYKRSGDSFRMMEHFDLEDMFGRRARPNIELGVLAQSIGDHAFRFEFWLRNVGRAVGHWAGFILETSAGLQISQTFGDDVKTLDGHMIEYAATDQVIHPNGMAAKVGSAIIATVPNAPPGTALACRVYAEGMAYRLGTVHIGESPGICWMHPPEDQ